MARDAVKGARPPWRVRKKPPGRFHHPDLREALVQAAIRSVEREGHGALSLRRLAAQTGVTQPAIYRHFRSKEALLLEVARRGLLDFDASQHAALGGKTDPWTAIEASGRAYVRFCVEHPGWFRLCFSRFGTEEIRIQSVAAEMTSHVPLLAAISSVVDSPERVLEVYRALWAQAHGLAVLVVERIFQLVQTDAERVAAADGAISAFTDALRARYGSAPRRAPTRGWSHQLRRRRGGL